MFHLPPPQLAIVAPCYNEELLIQKSIKELTGLLDELVLEALIHPSSFVLIVDDGSRDRSWELLCGEKKEQVKLLKLSRNAGHQRALLAGMHKVTNACDCMISIDFDLQDDLSCIRDMLLQYRTGVAIVYGVRNERTNDSWFKKNTALGYYKLLKKLGVDVIHNHADFRLLNNRVLQEFQQYKEANLFLRGMFPLLGYKTGVVYYNRLERPAGESKYPLFKMMSLAFDGITSFSNRPLRLISFTGFLVFFISIVLSGWVFIGFLRGQTVPGWASITLPIYLIAGIQLLSMGVIGEYISKIYLETKRRPPYHVEEFID